MPRVLFQVKRNNSRAMRSLKKKVTKFLYTEEVQFLSPRPLYKTLKLSGEQNKHYSRGQRNPTSESKNSAAFPF